MNDREKRIVKVLNKLGLLPPVSQEWEIRASGDTSGHVAYFLKDRCLVSDRYARTLMKDLYAAYCEWCEDNLIRTMTRNDFSYVIRRRHKVFVKNGTSNRVTCYGLSLIDPLLFTGDLFCDDDDWLEYDSVLSI